MSLPDWNDLTNGARKAARACAGGKEGAVNICQDGNSPEFQARLDQRRAKRMARIDAMAPDMRELVHHYGLTVVDTLMGLGITKPNQVRHVVETILDEFSPARGSAASQRQRVERRER